MKFEELFFVFVFLRFYESHGAENVNTEGLNLRKILKTDVQNGSTVTGGCTSNSDCHYGDCKIQNGKGRCICWIGITGNNCTLIEECEENKNMCGEDKLAECSFDLRWKKAYCRCKIRSKRYDVENKSCVDQRPCEKSLKQCKNEGYCAHKKDFAIYKEEDSLNEKKTYCHCPLGTSGDFCERVEECVQNPNYCGDGNDVECRMNPRINKIYCQCLDQNQRFDLKQNKCVDRKECRENDECLPYGQCTDKCQEYEPCIDHQHIEDKRSCHCVEGTSGHNCEVIDDCYNNVLNCGSDKSATCKYYHNTGIAAFAYCKCINETLVYDDSEKTCKECDCGPMGISCTFKNGKQVCKYKDPCKLNPCKNGFTCESYGSKFKCRCELPYSGKTCELSPCNPNPCKNGANCTVKGNLVYKCNCLPGYHGIRCSFGPCSSNPCENGGICSVKNDSYSCSCSKGYIGKNCELKDPCLTEMCNNRGKCNVRGNNIICNCNTPYSGNKCEKDPCSYETCNNRGKCSVDENDFKCHCNTPYYGNRCANECKCKNGHCIRDSFGNTQCECLPEYGLYRKNECRACNCGKKANCTFNRTIFIYNIYCICPNGKKLEKNVKCKDPCQDAPCENSGICESDGINYNCLCKKPYSGKNCENDPCTKETCNNRGKCTVIGNDFNCKCKDPYSGQKCEKDPCTNETCNNRGKCIVDGYDFICKCDVPYSGSRCGNDPCTYQTCNNRGKCNVEGNGFKCQCNTPYSGTKCENG